MEHQKASRPHKKQQQSDHQKRSETHFSLPFGSWISNPSSIMFYWAGQFVSIGKNL
jgi:hypothetical protein